MPSPVGFFWAKLIWKPEPVGHPEAGPSTVVEPEEAETSSFKVMLTLGFFAYKEPSIDKG